MLNESPIKIAAAHNYQVENEDAYDNQMGPYRVIAAGAGNARIINAKKEVVAKCAEGETFFDIAVSPSKKKIVAHTGSGRSKVYDFSAMKELEIPSNPPGENRFAFAEWRWLSEEVLMSFSGKQALDETGKPFTCCAGHTAEESELYIFSMVDQRLTKIELPGDSSVKVFALGRISNSGYFELLPTADHTNPEPKPVWFKFSLK